MKKIFILLFFTCVTAASGQQDITNQNLFDTETFMEEHYASRVSAFHKEPVETGQIIFLGDSIVEGGNWKELLGSKNVINRGIGGDNTFGILKRIDDIIKRKPAKLFLLIGINDIGKDIPDEVIADNCKKILKSVQEGSPDTEIYLHSILPVNPAFYKFPQHYNKEYNVIHTNRLLQDAAIELNCFYVNVFPVFMDKQQRLKKELSVDGLHLNSDGYSEWIKYLKNMEYLK